MKPRTQARIEKEIKRNERFLAELIEDSVALEKRSAEDIEGHEKRLKKLRAEPCFENTFEGKIREAEGIAFYKISIILKELSSATGKDYLLQKALTEIFDVERAD